MMPAERRVLFIQVDYEEFKPDTYNGVILQDEEGNEIDRCFTNKDSFEHDLEKMTKTYPQHNLFHGNSVDTYQMDNYRVGD